MCLKLSFNVCGTWCPDLVDNPRYTLGRELVARVCHTWCDLCVLEHLAVRIPKADSFDQERAGKRTLRISNHSQTGISKFTSKRYKFSRIFKSHLPGKMNTARTMSKLKVAL